MRHAFHPRCASPRLITSFSSASVVLPSRSSRWPDGVPARVFSTPRHAHDVRLLRLLEHPCRRSLALVIPTPIMRRYSSTPPEARQQQEQTRVEPEHSTNTDEGISDTEDPLLALHFSMFNKEAVRSHGAPREEGPRDSAVGETTAMTGTGGIEAGGTAASSSPQPSGQSSSTVPPVRASSSGVGGDNDDGHEGPSFSRPHRSPTKTLRVLRLHNLPKNWLHDDIAQFIDQVAEQEGIEPPSSSSPAGTENEDGEQEDHTAESMSTHHTASPFLHHLTVFFGRRTGIVYGSPRLVLTSSPLCDALLRGISFDPDDYRARIYFTEEKMPAGQVDDEKGSFNFGAGVSSVRVIEESMEAAQEAALDQLELDRYLFSPDLLYDIQRLHQRRLVTRNEAVLLDSFVDGEEDGNDGTASDENEVDGGDIETGGDGLNPSRRRKKRKGNGGKKLKKKKKVLAGEQSHLGRGSMQNMPIPKPYVQGRRI